MAVTKIWPIRKSLSKPINYVMNVDKTENPLFSHNIISEESYQALEDVIEYAANEDKTEQKYQSNGRKQRKQRGVQYLPRFFRTKRILNASSAQRPAF